MTWCVGTQQWMCPGTTRAIRENCPSRRANHRVRDDTVTSPLAREHETAEALVAEIEPDPQEDADVDRHQHVRRERIADAQVREHGATEIAGEQPGAAPRGPPREVQREAREQP